MRHLAVGKRRWIDSARSESGAALVELAIVVVMVTMVIGSILDYGTLFGDANDLKDSARSATLLGASTGQEPTSDTVIVRTIVNSANSQHRNIQKIIVFKSKPGQTSPSPPCQHVYPPPPGQDCNVYLPADFSLPDVSVAAGGSSWPSAARVPAVDYLGVWVQANKTSFFNLIWTPPNYYDSYVARLQDRVSSTGGLQPATQTLNGAPTPPTVNPGWVCAWPGADIGCATSVPSGGSGGPSGGTGGSG